MRKNKGFTLIEILVAISLSALVTVGLWTALLMGQKYKVESQKVYKEEQLQNYIKEQWHQDVQERMHWGGSWSRLDISNTVAWFQKPKGLIVLWIKLPQSNEQWALWRLEINEQNTGNWQKIAQMPNLLSLKSTAQLDQLRALSQSAQPLGTYGNLVWQTEPVARQLYTNGSKPQSIYYTLEIEKDQKVWVQSKSLTWDWFQHQELW